MSIFDFFSGNPVRTGMAMLLCGALAGGGAAVAVPAAIDSAADRVMDKVDARIDRAVDRSIDKADEKVDQYASKIKSTAREAGDDVMDRAEGLVDSSASKIRSSIEGGAASAVSSARSAYGDMADDIEARVRKGAEEGGTAAIKKAASDGTFEEVARKAIKSVAADGIVIDGLDELAYSLEDLRQLNLTANKIVMAYNQLRAMYGQHFENKALAAYYKGQSWYRDQGLDITADSLTGAARKSFVALKKLAKEECPDLYRKLCR